MAKFNELIKSYDKIKEYLRDFVLQGYKYRNDFTGKSARTYDNERRRIENYLSDYIQYEATDKGKRYVITSGSADMEVNPLFATWQSKSFTKNDVMLHFILIDVLMDGFWLGIKEITDIVFNEYLSVFDAPKIPDEMTVRNKLNEYVELGIFEKKIEGRTASYRIIEDKLVRNEVRTESDMILACRYYRNIFPLGLLGHFVLDQYLTDQKRSIFSFRQTYIAHTLDEATVLVLMKAIQSQSYVLIDVKTKGENHSSIRLKVLPLKIVDNITSGRRYLAVYKPRGTVYDTHRIDKIISVELREPVENFSMHMKTLNYHLSMAWGVSINKKKPLDSLEMVLKVDEAQEQYILDRLKREGRHGTVKKQEEGDYVYSILVSDAAEMIPWLRTFTGRIIELKCTSDFVEKTIMRDIHQMFNMYKEDLDVASP